jgi:hypothetical protein
MVRRARDLPLDRCLEFQPEDLPPGPPEQELQQLEIADIRLEDRQVRDLTNSSCKVIPGKPTKLQDETFTRYTIKFPAGTRLEVHDLHGKPQHHYVLPANGEYQWKVKISPSRQGISGKLGGWDKLGYVPFREPLSKEEKDKLKKKGKKTQSSELHPDV